LKSARAGAVANPSAAAISERRRMVEPGNGKSLNLLGAGIV
jgi:hypothetical protein